MNISRGTIHHLITSGLGYCCPWMFFHLFRKTGVIAARLGVTERAVRYAKKRVKEGEWVCEGHPTCMCKRMTLSGERRKRPLTSSASSQGASSP
jgi:hypothetical protein